MKTTVVNVKYDKDPNIVYIGRSQFTSTHFGNPFTHNSKKGLAYIILPTRELAIAAYKEWLEGTSWTNIEQRRRQWILDNLHTLKGKKLGCFCKPLSCHGDILIELLNKS